MGSLAIAALVMTGAAAAGLTLAAWLRSDVVSCSDRSASAGPCDGWLLDLVAAGLHPAVADDAVVAAAGEQLAGVAGVDEWRFERFPFEARLPRLGRGRWEVPADEPGCGSVSEWCEADGVEVPVLVGGLQVGRFVLRGPLCGEFARYDRARERAVGIVERAGSALAAGWREGSRRLN